MLSCKDLLTYDSYPQLPDVSLKLYKDFSESVLMKRRFHYYFTDGDDFIVEFQEFGIRHMLGIHHIDGNAGKQNFFDDIDKGLSLSSFSKKKSMNQRFKKMKPRIRLFACTYHTLRCGRIFYCPNRTVCNAINVNMDYIIYREIDQKGFNIGIRLTNGCYVPLTILAANESWKDKYIDQSQIKIVKRLLITDIKTNNVIEDIKYSDDFIVSDGVK